MIHKQSIFQKEYDKDIKTKDTGICEGEIIMMNKNCFYFIFDLFHKLNFLILDVFLRKFLCFSENANDIN